MGSSASFHLATKGLKVLTLERFGLNHKHGSSHGGTRIIRQAYAEDPRYVPLVRSAFVSWAELEKESGRALMKLTGGLMIGVDDGGLVGDTERSAREHSLPLKIMSGREVNSEFPAFKLAEDRTAAFEETAGVLFPEECMSAFVEEATKAGCEFRFGEVVSGWSGGVQGLHVRTARDTYAVDELVVCAGPWTGELLGGLIPLECERQVPLWFDPHGSTRFSPGEMPIFVSEEKDRRMFYGIPEFGNGVKVAVHHGGKIVQPDSVDRIVTEGDIAPVRDFVAGSLPGLGPEPMASTTCLYTNTPDSNFVVDFHPEDRRVVVLSACSGHGFKFAPVIGDIAADLLLEGKTRHDISFLSAGRFSRPRSDGPA